MTKETNVTETRSFIGKRIQLQQAVFEAVIGDKDDITITVESVGDKDVLFHLGDGIKLSISKEDRIYVNGDKLTLGKDRVVLSEDLKPYVNEISNKGSGCKFARYE